MKIYGNVIDMYCFIRNCVCSSRLLVFVMFYFFLNLCFAEKIISIEKISSLPESWLPYQTEPWNLLKIPSFKKNLYEILNKSSEDVWVKELHIVSNIGQAYKLDEDIVFCYEGNKIHGGDNVIRVVYNPKSGDLLLKKRCL